jgi:methyl-accepting chemotaxis protein
MNPDRNRGGMTVNALMQTGMFISIAVAVICIAALGFVSSQKLPTNILYLVVIFCAILVVLGILITHYVVQLKIKDRLTSLVDVVRDYTGGNRTVRAPVEGNDEFAMLAMSLNTLLDTQGGANNGAAVLGGSSEAAALQAQIEKLLQEVSAVGDGDLRVQAEVTPDTLGVLADSFNYMIEELAKVVGRVQATAVQVTNATRRILDRSAELAQASETQVEQIAQTTKAVEALAVFVQDVAHNAQLSADAALEALRNATKGQDAVRQTIDGMMHIRENVQETSKKIKRLGERSNEISEIVRIIDDIADQTNLLALNAAIQSAMAGEHGRGFAVVADEIRLLAERSTESTKRIATLVKSIQGDTYEAVVAMEDSTQQVVKGSQLADEAGRALNSIYGAVERQAQMIEGIAHAANEQTPVSEAVAAAMTRISEFTRQTDAAAQEAAVNVSYLAELSEQLRSSVSTFRLPDQVNELAGVGALAPVTSVTELSENGRQSFMPALGSGENGWNQGFESFPPLPEQRNSGSLVALSPRQGQYAFGNQQDFNGQFGLGGTTSGTTGVVSQGWKQQESSGQQYYSGQQNPGNGQPFGSQQGFGMPGFRAFGGQQDFDFGDMGRLESQQAPGPSAPFGSSGQSFPSAQNALPSSQGSGSDPFSPSPTGMGMPANKPAPSRPRWQPGQNQGQSAFGQDQSPFSKNG